MSIQKIFSNKKHSFNINENNLKSSTIHIKILSLIIGYAFWYAISQTQATKIWIDAPVCFYNIQKDTKISCKEKIKIQLFAKRADLYTIDIDTLAFHIDAASLKVANSIIKLDPEQLLLPESIKMIRCYPSNIAVKVESIKQIQA